jgi:hypothetical protein
LIGVWVAGTMHFCARPVLNFHIREITLNLRKSFAKEALMTTLLFAGLVVLECFQYIEVEQRFSPKPEWISNIEMKCGQLKPVEFAG